MKWKLQANNYQYEYKIEMYKMNKNVYLTERAVAHSTRQKVLVLFDHSPQKAHTHRFQAKHQNKDYSCKELVFPPAGLRTRSYNKIKLNATQVLTASS